MGRFLLRVVPSGVKFDLLAANGACILTSEVYSSAALCRKGIDSVRKNAAAALEDLTAGDRVPQPNPKYELYQDKAGAYRFRLKARNGKIIAVSDGYTAKSNCLGGIDSVRLNAPAAEITEE